jgi:hydroxymethylpyrimidine pyrophosphatase-like HAD family hydrolase
MKQSDNPAGLPVFRRAPGAIALDLDGTLLNSRVQISERNRRALEKCLARGIPVIIATARPARSVRRRLGDDIPDLEMMRACGTSIAMANAVPEVKAITEYCTASNDDDGVALALERLLSGIP